MIVCVCGMIGAGKTSYCRKMGSVVSDFDEFRNKKNQIQFTLDSIQKNKTVYHITCYPTREEQEVFAIYDVQYIWINTTFTKCKDNILKRKRKRDLDDFQGTLEKNREIKRKYNNSAIDFNVINVFEQEERW